MLLLIQFYVNCNVRLIYSNEATNILKQRGMWHGQCAFLLYANEPSSRSRFPNPSESDLWVLSSHALDVRCMRNYNYTNYLALTRRHTRRVLGRRATALQPVIAMIFLQRAENTECGQFASGFLKGLLDLDRKCPLHWYHLCEWRERVWMTLVMRFRVSKTHFDRVNSLYDVCYGLWPTISHVFLRFSK